MLEPREVFTDEQLADLEEHLEDVISEPSQRADAIFAVAMAVQSARTDFAHRWPLQVERSTTHQHRKAVSETATTLQQLLSKERPLWGTAGIDWPIFDATLSRLIDAANAEVEATKPPQYRGRPPEEWRDKLISVVFSVYPTGTAKKTAHSHFERTIEMLLQWLDRDVQDLHSVIVDALQRRPEPPFRVSH